MAVAATLSRNQQFDKNINDALSWMQTTDLALADITGALHRIRETVLYAANDAHTIDERTALAEEVDQLINFMLETANSEYNGRHVFAGFNTTKAPYSRDGDAFDFAGNNGRMVYEVSPFAKVDLNITGPAIFGENGTQLFEQLIEIRDAILSGDTDTLSNSTLSKMDDSISNILAQRTSLGAKINRLEAGQQRLQAEGYNLKDIRSKFEDIDYAQKITEFKMQENIYQASLATAAKIISPTLLQFLR
jgi:flagellar hook-associated protein 3 FlgL